MKKLLIVFVMIFTLTFIGCDFFTKTTTTSTTTQETTTTSMIAQTTIINDEITLVINAGKDTVEIYTVWIDAGAKFVLNGTEYNMTTLTTVDNSILGLSEVTYSYEYNSETYSITRYVIITDQEAPVIELNLGVDTIKVGETWIDGGVIVTDNSLEIITAVISGIVDINTAGTYEITYTATDSSNNTSSIIRYITIIE